MAKDNFLRLQSIYFRLLGLELRQDKEVSHRYPLRIIFCFFSVATFLPLTIAFGISKIQNVDHLTDALCSVLVDSLTICKIGFLLWLYADCRHLVISFQCKLRREQQYSDREAILLSYNKRDQFFSGLYCLCFLLAGVSACLIPLLSIFITHLRTGELQPGLPFPSVYPWDNKRPFNYLVSYLWNVSAAVGVALPTVCVDTLFCSLTHNLSALFEIAQLKLMNFRGRSLGETREKLVHAFQLYGECLELGQSLNGYFRPLIFAQFVAASLHLCVLCFQLSANLMQPAMLFYASFTIAILGQVSIYCFCGSSVKERSQQFAHALYESPWLQLLEDDIKLARSLPFAMMRAQRGCRIDGFFFEANRQTLILIVRSAISYVALLRSLA
ncbi:putative odorant receptor 98b [Drosophila bipectinata]|uniref:putative odorant receptor 98b n=1 Tax=Drosophila bipectinata TaxID=42026 RepID=UPI001C8A21C3|nr:putative odorant receptor 98b [Drosophila bipectinata]